MKKKERITVVISHLIAVAVSIIAYTYLKRFIIGFFLAASLENEMISRSNFISDFSSNFQWTLFIQCFLILYTLIAFPFLTPFFLRTRNLNRHNWWKMVAILELIGLFLVLTLAPPDFLSKTIYFLFWQLPVIVNTIVIVSTVRKNT